MSRPRGSFVRRVARALGSGLSVVTLIALAVSSHAATIAVTSASDAVDGSDGLCTLREAIVAANTNAGSGGAAGECAAGQAAPVVDVVVFAIPGAAVHTISPGSAYAPITEGVVIDGYTQAGASPNTQATGGSNAVLRVAIDGRHAGSAAPLLRFAAGSGGSEVRGLVVQRAQASAFHLAAPVWIAGNFIGTDATGTAPAPNATHGIEIVAPGPGLIGGSAPAERNVIAFSGGAGVRVDPAADLWRIVGNAMLANAKGIALVDGALPLANDFLDVDAGANARQNFPLIDSVILTPGSVRVQGRIEGAPSRTLLLDLYGSPPPLRPTSFLEGEVYLGAAPVPIVTDAQGKAAFDVTLAAATTANLWITATLTDVTGCFTAACGNTSEFSQRGVFVVLPRWGGADSALPVTVSGHLFQPGSSFAFGATPAPGQAFVDAQTLTGILPPLNPGTLYDVTVTHPGAGTVTMPKAFVTEFVDAAPGSQFYSFVMDLARTGITVGCLPGQYCGHVPVSRAQMALFLVRGLHGPFFIPPPATGVFADVPPGTFPVDWIEQFYSEGITAGCASNPLRYCPDDNVTRAQMAVFLLRAKHGPGYAPPACTGLFADVACAPPKQMFADWMEQLAREGITAGCELNPWRYCPDAPVLRLQMAAFLGRVLGLSEGGNQAPVVNAGPDQVIALPASANLVGAATDDGLPLSPGRLTYQWSKHDGPGTVTFGTPTDVATTASFSADGVYVLRQTVSDGALSGHDDVQVTVTEVGVPPPLNPPPIDPTVPTTVVDSTAFLYTGPNPVQTGVAPGTIVRQQAAVVRGKVVDRAGVAVPGVVISIRRHPEFGQTQTRSDGQFDMAVNGGRPLIVDYVASGYLPVQRQVHVPWQSYAVVPEVVMTPLDAQVSTIAGNAAAAQVHQASPVTDADGTRKAVLLFPAGTSAQMVLPNGTSQPLASFNVRATEYTVGPQGPRAMPGVLPPTSGYTYAVELSVDEALAAGATRVDFSQPVIKYVDNFLAFPVGSPVPTGYYDRVKAAWVAAPDGRVIRITGVTGGLASVDTVGTGSLPAIVLDTAERQRLAALYPVGQELWRVPISHFTPWDCNWPFGPPADAIGPPVDPPRTTTSYDGSCEAGGSIIDCEGQTLGESLGIPGTSLALRYRSDRVPARAAALEIPVTGPAVPSSLIEARVSIDVAGTVQTQTFPPVPNQTTRIAWDGLDAYGRKVQGGQRAIVRIDFVYAPVYLSPVAFGQSFGLPGDGALGRARNEILVSMTHVLDVGEADLRGLGLGGWALDVHHVYHPGEQSVQFGTGRVRRAKAIGRTITRVDFGGLVPVTSAFGKGWTVGPDGSIYFVTRSGSQTAQLRRRAPDGTLTIVAGNAQQSPVRPYGDGGPAVQASLVGPGPIEIGPDGSIFVADINVIRRIRPDGIIERFAGVRSGPDGGAGENCAGGIADGGPALASPMCPQQEMAVAPDGTLYFVDQLGGSRVRRVGPDGIVTTVAGTGTACSLLGFPGNPCGDGGPATQAQLMTTNALALGADGSLYLGDGSTVRRIGADGIIRRIAAQNGNNGFAGDGGPALAARFNNVRDLVVEADGTIHLVDFGNDRIRTIDTQGIVRTIAGTGQACLVGQDCNSGDGGPVGQARVSVPQAMKLGPDASVHFSVQEGGTTRIRRIGTALPGLADFDVLVPSPDGGEVHQFDRTGRHLRTRHPLTGMPLREFDYHTEGRLIRVREMTGAADNVTTIEHDAGGHPTAIVGPFGDRTTLAVDSNGFLRSFANANGHAHQFASTAGGLMTSHTDPRGNTTTFTYDGDGRLVLDAGPAGASQALARGELPTGFGVVRTTALGLATSYAVEAPTPGVERRTVVASDATTTLGERRVDASSATITHADGTIAAMTSAPDPRFSMQAPIAASRSVRLPSALERLTTTTRSVTLADPADPLSLTSLTDIVTVAGQATSMAWNGGARTLTITSPEGRVRTITLDALGRLAGFGGPGIAPATVTYDARGRIERKMVGTGPAARETRFAFDANGRVASITDPIGRVVAFTYDAAGRRIASTRPDGSTVQFDFDAASNLVGITPPGRPTHGLVYDARNALARIVPPLLAGTGATDYATDADGRLVSVTRPDGDVVTLAYDTGGRLASRAVTRSGAPVGTWPRAYDASGRVATVGAPGPLVVTYQWDGQLPIAESWSGPVAGTVARTFDTRFRPATESVNGAHTVTFNWGGDGFLTSAGALAIARDASTGLATGSTLATIADTFTRDPFGAPSTHVSLAGGTLLYATSWVRDAIDRVTQRRETVGAGPEQVFDYAYDALGRLVTVHRDGALAEAYAWDANGNRTSASVGGIARGATYDVHDRLLSDGATTYVYDALGRTATKTTGAAVTQYRYDPIGHLVEVERPGGQRIGYLTDGNGRRVGRLVDGVLVQGFLYAGALRPVAELNGGGAVVSRFVYAGGVAPAYMVRDATTYRLVTDGVGSVRLVVNAATGTIAQRIDYDAFGNVTGDTNPGFQPFGFAGGLYDRDAGLVRMGVRDYDPSIGRFTTRDPIGFAGGNTNLYAYAGGDPLNANDPTGLETDWHSFAAGLLYGVSDSAVDTLNLVFPVRALTDPIGNGIRQLLEDLGVGSYRDMFDVLIDAADLEVLVDRDSGEFLAGEMCAVGLSLAAGGAGLVNAARGGGRALASGAGRALAPASRAGGLTVHSVRDAELGIARVVSNEAAALDAAAAQQAARAADEGGLLLVQTSQRGGGIAPQNSMGGVGGQFRY